MVWFGGGGNRSDPLLDKVTKEVRHRQFREVQVEDENQTAAAMSVLNSLHNEGKLV